MALFSPADLNKTIDAVVKDVVPSGKRAVLMADVDLASRTGRASLVVKLSDKVDGYVRLSKKMGGALESDAGFKVTFLYGDEADDYGFTYEEIFMLLRHRGFGYVSALWGAYKLMNGQPVEL